MAASAPGVSRYGSPTMGTNRLRDGARANGDGVPPARRWTGRRRRPTATIALGTALLAWAVVGCGGSDDGGSGPTTEPTTAPTATTGQSTPDGLAAPAALVDAAEIGTYRVGRVERVLVDDSRPTKAHGGQPELPSRTLPTVVWYPAVGDPTDEVGEGLAFADGGPAPLIVFSHGSTRKGVHYEATLTAWASAGYVVAAPDYPLSTEGVPGGTDYGGAPEQAGDVSFVIDQMLAEPGPESEADDSDPLPWSGRIDPARLGLGGQSFGAITTLTAAADPCCADERIAAITEFAGFGGGSGEGRTAPPALFFQGSDDPTITLEAGRGAFDQYPGEGAFLTLVGSDHDSGYFGGIAEPLDELVTRSALAFYDRYLKGDGAAIDRLRALVESAGPAVATLEER